MKDKPIMIMLSVAVSAFVMGCTVLLFLDQRYVRRDDIIEPKETTASRAGSFRTGDSLVCWGTVKATQHDRYNNIKNVACTFPSRFIERPTVTVGIHNDNFIEGNATTWAEYSVTVTPTEFTGNLIARNPKLPDDSAVFSRSEVQVDYVAIGRWRK